MRLAVLDHLELAQAHFVGLSMGSYSSLQVALNAPERGTVDDAGRRRLRVESGQIWRLSGRSAAATADQLRPLVRPRSPR
jgi:pimeloyl-ACP methyl ester carboxylesterase